MFSMSLRMTHFSSEHHNRSSDLGHKTFNKKHGLVVCERQLAKLLLAMHKVDWSEYSEKRPAELTDQRVTLTVTITKDATIYQETTIVWYLPVNAPDAFQAMGAYLTEALLSNGFTAY